MLDYNFTDVEKKKSLIKEQINSLESYIENQETRIKAEKKAEEEKQKAEEEKKSQKANETKTTTETKTQNTTTQMKFVTKDEVLLEAIQWMYNN
jgi:septal ring factor EnvC (AmiA/AmiB activator)